MKNLIFCLLLILSSNVQADLLVSFVDESLLSYDLSPNNYNNSPNNYDNSINNYDNSPNNYDNSESNYDNSSSNFDNSSSGDKQLIVEKNNKYYRVGYYVQTNNGVINFFSTRGKRLFYHSGEGNGVFHGGKGFFCGALGRLNGKYQLILTKKGEQTLMLAK